MTDVSVSCKCGTLQGVLHNVSPSLSSGTHAICYCRDCQAFATHLGAESILDDKGASEIFQSLPERLEITKGAEHLACLRLSPKGLIRWYAACCDTPLGNTLASPKVHMVGLLVPNLDADEDVLGPIRVVANTKAAKGAPVRQRGIPTAIFSFFLRQVGAMFGSKKPTPFFDSHGDLRVTPRVLTREERAQASPN